ncbi:MULTISPECIES: glycerate kinase [Bacillaceae]|uniref:glycerate kinase n=1 Tax=Bacillaceae TaxID=186817 RepID=UPI001F2EF3D4|nr:MULTISPECIES: glycerate kinase [Bacillaceae]
MKIIVASDSFKGSLTNIQVSSIMKRAINSFDENIEVLEIPMADGGEGTVDAILLGIPNSKKIFCNVEDPLGRDIETYYGWIPEGKIAVIETAAASGLPLLSDEEKSPARATTFGTGQLILNALNRGGKSIILGLGGSATVDAGVGLFQALGLKVFDHDGVEMHRVGGELGRIARIDTRHIDRRLYDVKIVVASDVTNPLLGDNGAIRVFGPQKGVTADQIETFEAGMVHFSKVVIDALGKNMVNSPGSGAAGGIGFMLKSLLDVEFRSGLDIVVETSHFAKHLKNCDLVFTGEGRVDGQSLYGKVPVGIGRLAKAQSVPVIAFTGAVGEGEDRVRAEGISAVVPIVDRPMPLHEAMKESELLLYNAVKRTLDLYQLGRNNNING